MGKFDCLRGWLAAFLVGSIVLTGCSEQKKKTEKAPVKVETLTVGSYANGETNDYVGIIEERPVRRSASNLAETSHPSVWTKAIR